MFRRIAMAAPMASVLALCAPAAYQTAQAAAFPQVFGGASSPLLTLVQDRGAQELPRGGGGGGRGGGGDRGGGADRGGGGGGMIERGPRGGDGPGGGARRGSGDGDRSVLREERGRGDGDRGDRMRGRDRGDRSAQRDDRRGDRDFRRGRDRGGRHDRDRIRRHGRHFSWGPGISFYFYDGYYYGDCNWLRRRAIATGSSYWWRRFRQCRAYSW